MSDFILVEVNTTHTVLVSAPGPQGPPGDPAALLDAVHGWTRQQYYPLSALSINPNKSIDWDWDTQPEATVTLPGPQNYTLNLPGHRRPGTKTLRVYQNASGGGALGFHSEYILDVSLNDFKLAAHTFVDLYFKDDGSRITVFGGEYSVA